MQAASFWNYIIEGLKDCVFTWKPYKFNLTLPQNCVLKEEQRRGLLNHLVYLEILDPAVGRPSH